jgi:predicted nucleic acid-binding protein
MNGIRMLCDTNPLVYLLDGNNDIATFLDGKQVYISVISELELFGKQRLSASDIMLIETLVSNCFVVDINREIKQIYKNLKQVHSIKLPDALIAATAIYLDMPLLTFDKGFKNIPELQLVFWE